MSEIMRVYFDPAEIGPDGYPFAWHGVELTGPIYVWTPEGPPIKDLIREQAGNRCERCGHPYVKGQGLNGGWSPCDERCTHGGPIRYETFESRFGPPEAQWRILTVHHLNRVKHDCRWWNLAALCQRCHLTIQGKVWLERPWLGEHSEWFKPHAAGWYAWSFLGLDVSREEAMERLDEFLALEHRQLALE